MTLRQGAIKAASAQSTAGYSHFRFGKRCDRLAPTGDNGELVFPRGR
jgi:hypothetical protein